MDNTAHPTSYALSTWDRLSLASGVAAGAVYLLCMALFVVLVVPGMPPLHASAAEAVAFYAEQSRSPAYLVISYLWQSQLLFMPPFFAGLFAIQRRAEGDSGTLALAIFAAGMALSIIAPLVEMIEHHLLLGLAAAGGDPLIVRGFDGMAPVSLGLSGFPQAVVLAGTAALILGRRLAPRWLGWAALALAVLSLAATGTLIVSEMVMLGLLVALLFKLWVIALGIALLRRPRPATQPAIQSLPA